jgi:DNA-binding XRE family transcriptional regulator
MVVRGLSISVAGDALAVLRRVHDRGTQREAARALTHRTASGGTMENVARRRRRRRAKLCAEMVRDIRARLERGERQVDIAEAVGCSQQSVSAIKLGLVWRDVEVG